MSRRIVVDPITRIEGHLRIDVDDRERSAPAAPSRSWPSPA